MENFKNTLSVGAEKIAEEIQVSNQKEMSEVFNFIYSGASPQEIYEWLRNLQFKAWDEDFTIAMWVKMPNGTSSGNVRT